MAPSSSTRLVIADDHPLFRGALREAVMSVVPATNIDEAGAFGGAYQRADEEMLAIWRVAVDETRALIDAL